MGGGQIKSGRVSIKCGGIGDLMGGGQIKSDRVSMTFEFNGRGPH